MNYKCIKCGIADVEHEGDMCELCSACEDPYATTLNNVSANKSHNKRIIYDDSVSKQETSTRKTSRKILVGGNSVDISTNRTVSNQNDNNEVSSQQTVQVTQTVSSQTNNNTTAVKNSVKDTPLTSGITKNVIVDNQKKSVFVRICRALFNGIPYILDNEVTLFQVFPDYSGSSLNAMGNACDQVIVYGKINAGSISENNDVEVYGYRDSKNNVVAKKIINKASGSVIKPERTIPVLVVWLITLAIICFFGTLTLTAGAEGIVWFFVLLICITNLPLVIKIISAIFGFLFSMLRRM